MKLYSSIASALILAAPSAMATDYWVDSVNGNDAALGTSPATAWKTITHASTASVPDDLIHLAPGTYSTASGELFPLHFQRQSVVGDAGSANTVIDSGGAVTIELYQVYQPHGGPPVPESSLTQLTGVTARNASTFAVISTAWLPLTTGFSDVRLENVSGMCFQASAGTPQAPWSFQITLDHVDFSLAHSATLVGLNSVSGVATLVATDCNFSNAAGDAVRSTSAFSVNATFDRCRFTHDVGGAFTVANGAHGYTSATFRDCLLAHNSSGFFQDSTDATTGSSVQFERSTVADNTTFGIRNTSPQATTSIDGTIVVNNGVDVLAPSSTTQFSWISAGNPLFVDPASDDYRLRFGSPCIDTGHVGSGSGAPDLAQVVRPIDGDLDTSKRTDIGAFEFQPLRLLTSGHIGSPLRLEMAGQAGGTTTVYFTRGAPTLPLGTPYGEFELNPSTFGTLLHSAVAPFPPVSFQRPIPNHAILIGQTFSFQALTTSSVAPQGSAYTNVVSFTVLP
jgi:hypothetical protein